MLKKLQQRNIHLFLIRRPLAANRFDDAASCLCSRREVRMGEITSPALEGNLIGDPATRSYAIYLPPSYETSQKRYPVFYVLHGYTQSVGGSDKHQMDD